MRPGDTIAERYRMIAELGAGGMGAVYRVEHTMMAKQMAMKLLRPELSGIAEVAERFEREAKSVARLDHHHIVRVTDFGKTETGELFLVMELLEGQSLSGLLGQKGRLPPNEAILLVDQILEALEHAHGHGVIHRDLKPDNVMLVEKEGRLWVKLLDFGLAKMTETKLEEGKQLTTAGAIFGTPRYMSPEQAAGEPTDHRSDLYSAGVMLFELITGRAPFMGASTVEVLRMHLTQAPPPLQVDGLDPASLRGLEAVVHRAMSKSAHDRFADASSFRQALLACLDGGHDEVIERTHVRVAEQRSASMSLAGPTPIPNRPRTFALTAVGGAVLVVVIAILAATLSGGRAVKATDDLNQALVAGDVPRAQAMFDELRARSPNDARLPLYEGHLALAKNDLKAMLASYSKALDDPTLEIDPRFEANVLDLMRTRPKAAQALVKMVAERGGPSTAGVLAKSFEAAPNPLLRRHAYTGLSRLDAVRRLQDPIGPLAADLKKQSNRNCTVRKWYVEQLVQSDDPRVLEALKAEQNRRGNFLQQTFAGGVNRCMSGLLDAEIAKRRS